MADTAGDRFADVDIAGLSDFRLAEYRQELVTAIQHPGVEYEAADSDTEALYKTRLAQVDAALRNRTGSPAGGNL